MADSYEGTSYTCPSIVFNRNYILNIVNIDSHA